MAVSRMPINPDILKWARETAGYSLDDLVTKYPKYIQWEKGELFPTYNQLESIASRLHRPVAIFFFPEPPEETPIERSLRAIYERDVATLSPTVRFLFRKAKAFQINLRELHDTNSQIQKTQWLRDSWDNVDTIPELASQVRRILGVSIEEQSSWKNIFDALDNWRNALAENGVYVFKDPFKDDNVSGFCIYDDQFPIIYINNSQPKTRQVFTIFHELAHLLFNQSYLDVFDEAFWRLEFENPQHIEVMCNSFAGHFLVPNEAFRKEFKPTKKLDDNIENLAIYFSVSREVILRKLYDHQIITADLYNSKIKEWYQRSAEIDESGGGGNYYNSKRAYLGDHYLSTVFGKYYQGRISLEKAAEYLDIKTKSFAGLEDVFLKRNLSRVHI